MTKDELISDALRLIGAVGASEPVDPSDQALADRALRRMVGDWANQFLTAHASARYRYPVKTGKSVYRLGPLAVPPDWTGPKPASIFTWSVIPDRSASDAVEIARGRPGNIEEWQHVPVKTITSTIPTFIYPDMTLDAAGSMAITVYPVPSSDLADIVIYAPISIPEFAASFAADVVMPAGYEQAIVTNLALLLQPYFSGAVVSQDVRVQALSSLDNLKAQNWRETILPDDGAPWSRGNYNIYTDEYQR